MSTCWRASPPRRWKGLASRSSSSRALVARQVAMRAKLAKDADIQGR
jgi:hypothetical protein